MPWRWIVLVALVVASCGDDEDGAATTIDTAAAPIDTAPAPSGTAPATEAVAPTAPATAAAGTSDRPAAVVPEGFTAQDAEITAADGTVCVVCLWVAGSPIDRARGLMGVTDLGGADGMVFLFPGPVLGDFWMRDTPTPLSIAFFAADGSFVSSADMVPCLDAPDAACARYAAAGPYTAAVEVFAGGLPDLGIAPGSWLGMLGTPCDPSP